MQIQAAGLPWFEADDYESFKRLLPDRRWHPTFEEWEAAAEHTLQRAQNDGTRAIKAKVRSGEFASWCRRAGRNINTEALTAWGAEAARRAIEAEH